MVPLLLVKAFQLGFEVSLLEAYRPPEQAALMAKQGKGIKDSLHIDKLAIDLALFKSGKYLTATADYQQLGEYWESIGGSWGGRFNDGNHFSLSPDGKRK